jgi:hypothetical protein
VWPAFDRWRPVPPALSPLPLIHCCVLSVRRIQIIQMRWAISRGSCDIQHTRPSRATAGYIPSQPFVLFHLSVRRCSFCLSNTNHPDETGYIQGGMWYPTYMAFPSHRWIYPVSTVCFVTAHTLGVPQKYIGNILGLPRGLHADFLRRIIWRLLGNS